MSATVVSVHVPLPVDERAGDLYNAYWHWGPGADTGGPLVIVGGDVEDHGQVFTDVREAGRPTCALCMPYEQEPPIYVCRGWKRPLCEVWPQTRHFEEDGLRQAASGVVAVVARPAACVNLCGCTLVRSPVARQRRRRRTRVALGGRIERTARATCAASQLKGTWGGSAV